VRERWRAFARRIGANPLQLLSLLGALALVGYVLSVLGTKQLWNPSVWWQSILVWFLGAIVFHDVLLFPLYAVADRSLVEGWRAATGRAHRREPLVAPINYVRIPIMGSGLLFLLFFPGIVQQGKGAYLRATGLTQAPFLDRWLLLSGSMFLLGAVLYAVRVGRSARRSVAVSPQYADPADREETQEHAT
jgi:hypothetical protein